MRRSFNEGGKAGPEGCAEASAKRNEKEERWRKIKGGDDGGCDGGGGYGGDGG